METLTNGKTYPTIPGQYYVLTANGAVSIVDGTEPTVELAKLTEGQVSFQAVSQSVQLVITTSSTVKGAFNKSFNSAPTLQSQGGGGTATDLDRHTVTLFAEPKQIGNNIVCDLPMPVGYEFDAGSVFVSMYSRDGSCSATWSFSALSLLFDSIPQEPNGIYLNTQSHLIPWMSADPLWSYVSVLSNNATCSTSSNAVGLNRMIFVPEGYKLAKIMFENPSNIQANLIYFFLTFNVKKQTDTNKNSVSGEYVMTLENTQPIYDNYV